MRENGCKISTEKILDNDNIMICKPSWYVPDSHTVSDLFLSAGKCNITNSIGLKQLKTFGLEFFSSLEFGFSEALYLQSTVELVVQNLTKSHFAFFTRAWDDDPPECVYVIP